MELYLCAFKTKILRGITSINLPGHSQLLLQVLSFYRWLLQWFEGIHQHIRDTFQFVLAVERMF